MIKKEIIEKLKANKERTALSMEELESVTWGEYSCGRKPQFQKIGNRYSG